jgi:hypothetical protein
MSWKSIADLIVDDPNAPVAILGAPMEAGSVTPGRFRFAMRSRPRSSLIASPSCSGATMR